ncbi:hypothetical protein MWH36_001499 [Salmonella enterica]|nr:hypothetical protein [Salmonella enterica subsp. enterica]EJA4159316.1 hypothetical protein [Salmonella enterica]
MNAPDGLFERIAADIQKLRASGMNIMATDIEVFDSRTGTTRIDTATACFM